MYEFKSCRSRKASETFSREFDKISEIQPGLVMRGRSEQKGLISMLGLENFGIGQVNSAKVVRSTVFRHEA